MIAASDVADARRAVELLESHPGWDRPLFSPGDDSWFIPADETEFSSEELRELGALGFIQFPGGGFCSVRWRRSDDGVLTERPGWPPTYAEPTEEPSNGK